MPALNGAGPQGQGPRTGRGLGNCLPTGRTNWSGYGRGWFGLGRRFGRSWFGRGLGRGFGFGRGWGRPLNGYPVSRSFNRGPADNQEKEMLGEELQGLKEEMKGIEARLEELKNKK